MSKIYGSLTVPVKEWRFIYNNILNYFNQEISVAYNQAVEFYNNNKSLSREDFQQNLNDYFLNSEITDYRKYLIKSCMLKSNTTIYKPKKSHFSSYNNRTLSIDAASVLVNFDKENCTVSVQTTEFEDFDKYMATNSFITEFVNMVNTINWPTRKGPSTATRGCTLIRENVDNTLTTFFSVGPNPPSYEVNNTEVVEKPAFLDSDLIKNIKLTNTTPEETYQPVPEPEDLTEV